MPRTYSHVREVVDMLAKKNNSGSPKGARVCVKVATAAQDENWRYVPETPKLLVVCKGELEGLGNGMLTFMTPPAR